MASYRLKNIIILILALTNLCLLGLLAVRMGTGYSSRQEATEQMAALFAAEGVSLDPDLVPGTVPPAGLILARDSGEERKLAEFLLDEALLSSDSGGVRTYQGRNGSAIFRADGSFDVTITGGDGGEELCRAFCRAFHYEDLSFSLKDGSGTASAVQTHSGAPVVNCTVTFFLSGGAVVTAVTDLYLCYELQSTTAAPMALMPAWCVVTDTADYYVNSYTGEVTAA